MPSDKITSKNLSYDQSLPPFLARLRAQQTSGRHSPDPILAARRRPGRVRSASEEAEDEPLVVDEDGNVVHVEPGQLVDGAPADGEQENNADASTRQPAEEIGKEKEKEAGIGATKKRKVGKVIGGDEEESVDKSTRVDDAIARAVNETKKFSKEPAKGDKAKRPTVKPAEKTAKNKAKKIKLSFGDDDG